MHIREDGKHKKKTLYSAASIPFIQQLIQQHLVPLCADSSMCTQLMKTQDTKYYGHEIPIPCAWNEGCFIMSYILYVSCSY